MSFTVRILVPEETVADLEDAYRYSSIKRYLRVDGCKIVWSELSEINEREEIREKNPKIKTNRHVRTLFISEELPFQYSEWHLDSYHEARTLFHDLCKIFKNVNLLSNHFLILKLGKEIFLPGDIEFNSKEDLKNALLEGRFK